MFLVDMDVDVGGSLHDAFGDVTIGGTRLRCPSCVGYSQVQLLSQHKATKPQMQPNKLNSSAILTFRE